MFKPLFEFPFKGKRPATPKQIHDLIQDLRTPLSPSECHKIDEAAKNPYRDIKSSNWVLPPYLPPKSYLQYLTCENGGQYDSNDHDFILFGTKDLKSTMLGYHVPEYMPKALPFGGDGGGSFYFFDMRNKEERETGEVTLDSKAPIGVESDIEFPVYVTTYIGMSFEDAQFVADSFLDLVEGRFDSFE